MPVVTLDHIVRHVLPSARDAGKVVVTTNGCFDIITVAHVRYLQAAKQIEPNALLLVGINSDDSVRKLKGPSRPINPQDARLEVVAALRAVDYAFLFEEDDPRDFLRRMRPHIHVKGGDYIGRLLEQDVVEENGGRVQLVGVVEGVSTTKMIERIKGNSCG